MSLREQLTISVPEAAELSGIGRSRLYQLCHTEGFPAIRFGGRHVRIHRERFIDWVNAQAGGCVNVPRGGHAQ